MSFMDFVKKQFIDVIEWNEEGDGVLSFRYPMRDMEIQNGARLTVRDSQMAMFVNEGQVADVFKPGLHQLTTRTLPVLTNLMNWDKMFASPFKSDVYFFSTRDQINQRWGTPNPIVIRDKDYGPIRLRANGIFSYKIDNPETFFKKISGTREQYTAQELDGQLKGLILTTLANFFGNAQVSFVDMAANQTKFSDMAKEALAAPFTEYGIALQSFYVQSITLPEELQAYLDKASSMSLLGDLKKYAQFQTADSIPIAAANEGGLAGAGAGLGAGMAIGQTMAGALGVGGASAGGGNAGQPAEDPMAAIEKLHGLMTKGIITQAEFDAKKAELLRKIT